MSITINDSILTDDGWVKQGVIEPREIDNGHIILYSSSSCMNRVQGYMSNNIDLTHAKYTRINCSWDYYELPCLFMFVTERGECLIQIAPKGLKEAIGSGVMHIIENGQESSDISISRDVAMALEDNILVYLYYWPIVNNAEPYLLEHKEEFSEAYFRPIWLDC